MTLYDFSQLQAFLDRLGFKKINKREFIVTKENFQHERAKGNIRFGEDGIYLKINETEYKGYIFNQRPNIGKYGLPAFHVAECEVIQNRNTYSGDYIWSNANEVQLYDRGNNGRAFPTEGALSNLKLCLNCRKMLRNVEYTTQQFFDALDKGQPDLNKPNSSEVDILGYTLDWNVISKKYRRKLSFVCKSCKKDLSEPKLQRFLHVHHKNGDKTDNRDSNLECLCIECHSIKDERHKANFEHKNNKAELESFKKFFYN